MIQLSNSVVQAILSAPPAIQTGNIFALPVVATQFTWQTSFTGTPTAIAIQILTSLDGTNFVLAASSTSTAGESKTVLSSAAFIQARIDTVTPGPCTLVTVSVIAEEGHDVIQGGGGAALPTATVGQVLISQGVGVDSVFSNKVTLVDPTQPADQKRWSIYPLPGGYLVFDAENDAGSQVARAFYLNRATGQLITNQAIQAPAVVLGVRLDLNETPLAGQPGGQVVGALANISDSTVNTWGATVVGGGSFHVLARWNGTIWKVVGI
jgi:hypothetical protein